MIDESGPWAGGWPDRVGLQARCQLRTPLRGAVRAYPGRGFCYAKISEGLPCLIAITEWCRLVGC